MNATPQEEYKQKRNELNNRYKEIITIRKVGIKQGIDLQSKKMLCDKRKKKERT